ncbi:MAG: RNA polymerase sigma factor [Rhodospirillales bacterium]|nr:RNA polymerase sigma factor [Rhodospirillales bacterium]
MTPALPATHEILPSLLPALRAFLRRFMRDKVEAHDIAQEAALRALGAREVPSGRVAYRAWLFQIARNAAIDAHRRHALAEAIEPAQAPGLWASERTLISSIAVRQGLLRISPEHRGILLLVDVEGLTYKEAARHLGIPEGTVMSRVSRARAALLGAIAQGDVDT